MILDKLAQSTYKRVEEEKKQNPLEEVKGRCRMYISFDRTWIF